MGAALAIVAMLAAGPAAYAQGPKPGDKPANTNPKPADKKPADTKPAEKPGDDKTGNAKDPPKDPPVKWEPGKKLDWSNFKGGMPT
ncbi:MAG TPA: hypothetical protein VLL30_12780, partial [Reyranella sp.]|nr:hypothetical protein [Reyranella sp.]